MNKNPIIRRNAKELIENRIFDNGKALFLYNSCFYGEKFTLFRALWREAFRQYGVGLDFKTSENIGYSNKYDFSELLYDTIVFYDKDISLASRLERAGFKVINPSEAIRICDSKIETGIFLTEHNIPTIPFLLSPLQFEGSEHDAMYLFSKLGGEIRFPIVIKEEFGSLGEQVYLANNELEAIDIIMKIHPPKRFIIEPYYENKGEDHRLYIVGDKVIGAIRRKNPSDFRSNIELGGKGYPYEPSEKEIELALKASKALNLDFSGVDILLDEKGKPLICEVNSCPRFLGLLDATSINMAKEIAKYLFFNA